MMRRTDRKRRKGYVDAAGRLFLEEKQSIAPLQIIRAVEIQIMQAGERCDDLDGAGFLVEMTGADQPIRFFGADVGDGGIAARVDLDGLAASLRAHWLKLVAVLEKHEMERAVRLEIRADNENVLAWADTGNERGELRECIAA